MDNTSNENNTSGTDRELPSLGNTTGIDISQDNQSDTLDDLDKSSQKLERDESGKLLPGQPSLNPKGRPKGSISPIQRVKQIFAEQPNRFKEFIEEYLKDPQNRKHIVEMIDGKPKQTVAGDKENPLRIITLDKEEADLYGITPSKPEDDTSGQDEV
jgi:hypothetical protein